MLLFELHIAAFARFISIACFLNSLSTGSELSVQELSWLDFNVAVDLLRLGFSLPAYILP